MQEKKLKLFSTDLHAANFRFELQHTVHGQLEKVIFKVIVSHAKIHPTLIYCIIFKATIVNAQGWFGQWFELQHTVHSQLEKVIFKAIVSHAKIHPTLFYCIIFKATIVKAQGWFYTGQIT